MIRHSNLPQKPHQFRAPHPAQVTEYRYPLTECQAPKKRRTGGPRGAAPPITFRHLQPHCRGGPQWPPVRRLEALLLTLESGCSSVQVAIYAYHLAAYRTPTTRTNWSRCVKESVNRV